MPRGLHRALLPLALAVSLIAVDAIRADADVTKCQRAIARAGAKFAQKKTKALAKCEAEVVAGKIAGPCPDGRAATAVAKATSALAKAIGTACGGVDKTCGGDRDGEPSTIDLGWPATCPSFEHRACTNPISDCGGIATCIACAGGAAVDRTVGIHYDALALPSSGATHACQLAIGKAGVKFEAAKTKALQKCWDARLLGKHGDVCVPPNVGDGKYLGAIAKAEAKRSAAICKECGGPDGQCGTVDDLTPAAIGFPSTCPAATVPGGTACGGPIGNLTDLVACVGCITEFAVDCGDRLAVPSVASYPSACNVCLTSPASGPCPTTLEFTAHGRDSELDTGFSGLAHNAHIPTNGRLTLALSGCAGATQPTCGECSVSGPLPSAGGVPFDDHRCSDAPWLSCSVDGDCVTQGAAGPCVFFFGAPLPLVAGGVGSCIVNEIVGPVTGTANLDDGTSSTRVSLSSRVYVTETAHPCPRCLNGKCSGGERMNQPCVVQAASEFGDVSLDCVPSPGSFTSALGIALNLATGSQTRTVSAANPRCTQSPGYTALNCQCDTCNTINAEPCSTNADCPISGGNPGICGGKRCQGGINDGAPCTNTSACPPNGICGRPGEGTQPNACLDDTSTPLDGRLCQDVGGNEGKCVDGPFNSKRCTAEYFRQCVSDADCTACPDCTVTAQTCQPVLLDCFTDNGVIGSEVRVDGSADTPCGAVAFPTVGSFFCVAPVAQGSINATTGLPALGRIRVPGTVVVSP